MSLTVNGAAILKAIAEQPSSFGMSETQVNLLAMSAIVARLKDKLTTLPDLRAMHRVLGESDTKTAFDQCAAKDIAAITKRVDPKNPELRGSDERWQRDRLIALVGGAEPAQPASRTPRPKAPPRATSGSKTGTAMKSKALKANREIGAVPEATQPPSPARSAARRRPAGTGS